MLNRELIGFHHSYTYCSIRSCKDGYYFTPYTHQCSKCEQGTLLRLTGGVLFFVVAGVCLVHITTSSNIREHKTSALRGTIKILFTTTQIVSFMNFEVHHSFWRVTFVHLCCTASLSGPRSLGGPARGVQEHRIRIGVYASGVTMGMHPRTFELLTPCLPHFPDPYRGVWWDLVGVLVSLCSASALPTIRHTPIES